MKVLKFFIAIYIFFNITSVAGSDKKLSSPPPKKSERQSYLLKLEQKEQYGTGAIQKPPLESKEVLPPEKEIMSINMEKVLLSKGWRLYKSGKYQKAQAIFREVFKYNRSSKEAEMGLAFCYAKEEKLKEARSLLKKLVDEKYRLEDLVPFLTDLFLKEGDVESAELYVNFFKDAEREKWKEKIETARLQKDLNLAIRKEDIESLIRITEKYKDLYHDCKLLGLFYHAGEVLLKLHKKEIVIDLYLKLLEICPDEFQLRISIFYSLKNLLPFKEINFLIEKEIKRGIPEEFKRKIINIKLDILREMLAKAEDEEKVKLALEILTFNQDDRFALPVLGWSYYKKGEFYQSGEIFKKLHMTYPEDMDYTMGLIESLLALESEDEALKIAEESQLDEEKRKKVKLQVLLRKTQRAYHSGDFNTAEIYLNSLLSLDSTNDSVKELMGWTLFNKNELKKALPFFLELYKKNRNPKFAEAALLCYEKLNRPYSGIKFAKELSINENKDLKRIAGDYFFKKGMFITAASVYKGSESCYYNANRPFLETDAYYSHKSGDSGLSRFDKIVYPVFFTYPLSDIGKLSFSIVTKRLSAGYISRSQIPFVGNFYKYLNKGTLSKHKIQTSLWTITPEVKYENEGYYNYHFQIGTTPLGGILSSHPVFLGGIKKNGWVFSLHQFPLEETILSYTGLRDPYSSKKWGRVIRDGARIEKSFRLFSSYWLSFTTGYDYLWGEDVWKNQMLEGSISLGKTFSQSFLNFSPGIFITSQHFERNSNFFTFGHGGYYSPEIFLMIGPTLHLETKPCRSYWFNGNFALGYFLNTTEDAPHYPLKEGKHNGLNELNKRYQGRRYSGLAYNINLDSLKLLNPYLAAGCFFRINKSPSYTEWISGIRLLFYFGWRTALLPQMDILL